MLCSTTIPSHKLASWLLNTIHDFLDNVGLRNDRIIQETVYVITILCLSIFVAWALKKVILATTKKFVALRDTPVSRELLREQTLRKCAHIIPPLIFMAMLPFAFNADSDVLKWIMRLAGIYALIAFGLGLSAVFTFIFNRYNAHENTHNHPIRGILNVAVGIVWILIAIIGVSILIGKSPGALLAGLGAFAAALMLIFKDSILGFVAGIQMSQNDMLRVGDWIVVPSTIANGYVIDVSLSVVKIQNWDNTIVMVPPYTLVSTSFQNYRGMVASGMRRIARSYTIDIASVQPATPQFIEQLVAKVPELGAFVERVKASGRNYIADGGTRPVNGSMETNLGLFRAYCCQYLLENKAIAKDGQILVRLMDPTNAGIPLQIWCWTATTAWNAYEGIQSALFEHLAAMMSVFNLTIYSSGSLTVEGPVGGPEIPVEVTHPQQPAAAKSDSAPNS